MNYPSHNEMNASGFMDTLKVFEQTHPGRDSYKQKDLVRDILGYEYQAGNAHVDASKLRDLMHTVKPTPEIKQSASFSIQDAADRFQRNRRIQKNKPKLECLVRETDIPSSIQIALAADGLTEEHLKKVFCKDGKEGIRKVFTSLVDGKPRITRTPAHISLVALYLEKQLR